MSQASARKPIIVSSEGVEYPERVIIRKRLHLPHIAKVVAWWDDAELDVTWPWIVTAEIGWMCLVIADFTQPFTTALHWFWFAPLLAIQSYGLFRLAQYVRYSDTTPPTEVRPAIEIDDDE